MAKQYRAKADEGAHERSHKDVFLRKVKFWDEMTIPTDDEESNPALNDGEDYHDKIKADAPPVFMMPDGLSYLHVKRNGLIFGCSTARNESPITIIEVSFG